MTQIEQALLELQNQIEKVDLKLDEWRPESVVLDTQKDPQLREFWDKHYATAKASNRLHTNSLNQQQSHRKGISKELKELEDHVLGGLDTIHESNIKSQTWDFHNGQQNDDRWEIQLAFMAEVRDFMSEQRKVNDDVMSALALRDPNLMSDLFDHCE